MPRPRRPVPLALASALLLLLLALLARIPGAAVRAAHPTTAGPLTWEALEDLLRAHGLPCFDAPTAACLDHPLPAPVLARWLDGDEDERRRVLHRICEREPEVGLAFVVHLLDDPRARAADGERCDLVETTAWLAASPEWLDALGRALLARAPTPRVVQKIEELLIAR